MDPNVTLTTSANIEVPIAAVEKIATANEEIVPHTNGSAIDVAVTNGTTPAAGHIDVTVNGDNVPEVKPRTVVADDATVVAVPELEISAAEHVAVSASPVDVAVEAIFVEDTAAIPEQNIPAAVNEVAAVATADETIDESTTAADLELDIPAAVHVTAVNATAVPESEDIEPTTTEVEPILTTFDASPIPAAVADISVTPAVVETPAAVADISVTPAPETPIAAATGLLSLPEYVQQAIKEIAVREGFINFETEVSQDDGFFGEMTAVTLTGEQTRNGVVHADSDLSLIVKLPPTNAVSRENFAMRLFEREVFVYVELLPAFERFQLEHGLRPGQAGFHSFPRCYHAHYDLAADQAVLILENLTTRGFAMESKHASIKYEYARTVLEKLAELHGISLAMRQQRPAEFERFQQLGDVRSADSEQAKEMARTMMLKAAERAVTALEPSETVLREKVLRAADAIVEEADRYRGENTEPYSVINHGDCWVNNLLFKHESGQSRQVSFNDWQCTRYAPPVVDIVYFMFLCTDAPLRARHYDDLIQAYHHALRAQLDRLNADVNELFPFTAMLRQLKQYGRYALGAAMMLVPMMSTVKSDLPSMSDVFEKIGEGKWDGEDFGQSEEAQQLFKARMGGILRDMNKKGFF